MKNAALGIPVFLLSVSMAFGASAAVDDKDCASFSSHQEVMEFWYANGFNAANDPHRLDGDGDGLACEVSQSEYTNFVMAKQTASSNDETEAIVGTAEGEEIPDTASYNPFLMLIGIGAAIAGSLLLFRRKHQAV